MTALPRASRWSSQGLNCPTHGHHRERVAGEPSTAGRLACTNEQELAAPFREGEEEREQPRAEEQPGRDADLNCRGAGGGAQDEERGDRRHVEDDDVLETERVGD